MRPTTFADMLPEIYEFPLMDEEAPTVPLKSEDMIISAYALQPPPSNIVYADEFERFKEEIRNEIAAQRAKIGAQYAKQEAMDEKLNLLIKLATKTYTLHVGTPLPPTTHPPTKVFFCFYYTIFVTHPPKSSFVSITQFL